jgi:SAM-dependent methyltransferase
MSPAAERNKEPIRLVLQGLLPSSGLVLEVGSGTGQHVAHFAQHFPQLEWQPSDRTLERSDEIEARTRGLANVRPPVQLDVLTLPWRLKADFVFNANTIHIAPRRVTEALFRGAAGCLAEVTGVCMATYGPYFEAHVEPAASNLAFDQSLRDRDPSWGIRQREDVEGVAGGYGFRLAQRFEMPANNLLLAWSR